MTPQSPEHKFAFDAGVEAGVIKETLREHEARLAVINGSIASTRDALIGLHSEIRGLREDARLRDERVVVAASTLAAETERRREELVNESQSSEFKLTHRERIAALVVSVGVAIAGYLLR